MPDDRSIEELLTDLLELHSDAKSDYERGVGAGIYIALTVLEAYNAGRR